MKKVPIFSDLFDIGDRLKSIDRDYYIMYDSLRGRYELHNARCKNTLQLVLPFERLDSRTITHVYNTLTYRNKNIMAEIDAYNDKLNASRMGTILDKAQYKTKELMNYLSAGGSDIPDYEDI